MLKPSTTNASVGIRCVPRHELTTETLSELSSSGEEYFLEEFVKGRIMTIGTIPVKGEVYASHPLEYVLDDSSLFMDEDWKYNPRRAFPEDLDKTIVHRMQSYARRLHATIRAEGIARSDYILTNNGDIFCLEINTNVGLGKSHDIATAIAKQGDLYEHLVLAHLLTARNKK